MNLFLLVIFFFLQYPHAAFAGHETGNGGDIIVCKNDAGTVISAELLDFYEARVLRGIPVQISGVQGSYIEIAKSVIKRMEHLSTARTKKYIAMTNSFESEMLLLSGIILTDISDSANIALPSGNCSIEQIANQREPIFPEDKRYTISRDLWDLLDDVSKAGLILHEIVYREAIEYKHVTSIESRYFNSYLFGNKFKNFTQKDFFKFLQTINFPITDILGLDVSPPSASFYDSGKIKSVKTFSSQFPFKIEGLGAGILKDENISFYEMGSLESFKPSLGSLYNNGIQVVPVNSFCRVQLFESQRVKSLCISEPAKFLFDDDKVRLIQGNVLLNFDFQGRVVSTSPIVGT